MEKQKVDELLRQRISISPYSALPSIMIEGLVSGRASAGLKDPKH